MISSKNYRGNWHWTLAMTLLLLTAVGCTKDGDFWNLGRRNPNDAGLNVNPEDDRLPLVRTLPALEGETTWRAELINEGRRKMETVGWIWSEDGSDPTLTSSPSTLSDNVELGIHVVPTPGRILQQRREVSRLCHQQIRHGPRRSVDVCGQRRGWLGDLVCR